MARLAPQRAHPLGERPPRAQRNGKEPTWRGAAALAAPARGGCPECAASRHSPIGQPRAHIMHILLGAQTRRPPALPPACHRARATEQQRWSAPVRSGPLWPARHLRALPRVRLLFRRRTPSRCPFHVPRRHVDSILARGCAIHAGGFQFVCLLRSRVKTVDHAIRGQERFCLNLSTRDA